MPGKSFSRAVRKSHIEASFINRYRNGSTMEVTSAQVAKALMLEPSGHIRTLLAELVYDGVLDCRKVDNPHGSTLVRIDPDTGNKSTGENAFKIWYKLSEKRIAELEENARDIKIKVGGKVQGQLKLW
jgi:hypothetical protein